MDLNLKNINELIDMALKTTNLNEMFFLKEHSCMLIRRALAKNLNITQDIISTLLFDPVQNVSYIASINPNNKDNSRIFEDLRPCVTCEKHEKNLNCIDCPLVKDHKF
ncbi:MAG: hypothetical protein PHY66_01460 [Aliarcobacter sp.]|nr:hypothetical protein [Aliarcobacter sp.]